MQNYPRFFKEFGAVKINVMNYLQSWLERVEYVAIPANDDFKKTSEHRLTLVLDLDETLVKAIPEN